MTTLLNSARPPVFCPGCAHERVVHALDQALQALQFRGEEVAIVTDIGCSGLFDTFFHTHALHGLHGRALTYATGLKLARPELKVITVMGDGGLGIGGAHLLASCRRNLGITLLVLNNFNYGMTGGQYSVTTPSAAATSSGFLNQLEPPLDVCRVAVAAGAPWVGRIAADQSELVDAMSVAIAFDGFSLLEIQGLCTGRYTRKNPGAREVMRQGLQGSAAGFGPVAENGRPEYGQSYRRMAGSLRQPPEPLAVKARHRQPAIGQKGILLLGAAGQRINTAGELLALAAMSGGLRATQKNDYPITVLRGHSVSEILVSASPILYTGIETPDIILALAEEGVARRRGDFARQSGEGLVIKARDVAIPQTAATVREINFQGGHRVPSPHRALAALAVLTRDEFVITPDMLIDAVQLRFSGKSLDESMAIIERMQEGV
jgi:2-oxoglutarate/2-oxoacid ferredoxin oxidoreductase subunit beta